MRQGISKKFMNQILRTCVRTNRESDAHRYRLEIFRSSGPNQLNKVNREFKMINGNTPFRKKSLMMGF